MDGFSVSPTRLGGIFGANTTYLDDVLLRLGTDNDQVLLNRASTLAANTALTSVLIGTVVGQALAANSLIISNVTAAGDVALYGNRGGNSEQFLFYDTSAGILYVRPGQFDTQFGGAASTTNSRLLVENTSNAAAASHAYLEVSVGGTTSTGDPQFRLTIPGGTSWYVGADNSANDNFQIGTGTAVGSSYFLSVDPRTSGVTALARIGFSEGLAITLSDSATALYTGILHSAQTATLAGQTQVTGRWDYRDLRSLTIAQSGGAVTVDVAAGLTVAAVLPSTSVTLTTSASFLAPNPGAAAGTLTNLAGFYSEGLTRGANNYQILLKNGGTEPSAAPADHVGLYAVDIGAAAVLGIVSETAVVTPAGDFALTSKLIVRVNGVSYAIGMTTVLT